MLLEASIKKACVVKARGGCNAGNGVGRGKQKILCVVQPLLQEIFRDRLSHVFFEGVANMLLCIRNIFCDFAYRHIVKIGRTKQVEYVLYPAGESRSVEMGIRIRHKQQYRRSDTTAQTVIGRSVYIQRKGIERVFKEGYHVNIELGV